MYLRAAFIRGRHLILGAKIIYSGGHATDVITTGRDWLCSRRFDRWDPHVHDLETLRPLVAPSLHLGCYSSKPPGF